MLASGPASADGDDSAQRGILVQEATFEDVLRRSGIDALYFEVGISDSSNSDVLRYGLDARWRWNRPLLEFQGLRVNGYWSVRLGYWDNDSSMPTNSGLVDVGVAPVLRIEPRAAWSVSPYLEAGVGAHLLTESSVSTQRRFGGAFQFGSFAGAGVRFGPKQRFDLGYQFQHLSNAGLSDPNNGINFHQIRLGYWF